MSCPVLTPICKNYKPVARGQTEGPPCSKRDYEEQQERAKHGQQLMWDDAKGNPTTKPGGLFAFIHNGKRAQIHIVKKICSTDERLQMWSRNVGHGDRNVLMLSPKLMDIDWKTWSEELEITPKMERGTRVVRSKADILNQYVAGRFNYEFEEETGEIIVLN